MQIAREGKHAIYRKSRIGFTFEVFEVVVIQEMPDHVWPTGLVLAHERLPGNEQWGSKGWTCQTLEPGLGEVSRERLPFQPHQTGHLCRIMITEAEIERAFRSLCIVLQAMWIFTLAISTP